MMDMVRKHASDPTIVLYCGKFLKAKSVTGDGEEQDRTQGTPQGGVISPILANLYLHEVFDAWMTEKFSDLKWERYADDIIVHCVNEQQAVFVRGCIEERMKQFRLELHPEKTRIVYTGTSNHLDHRGHDLKRKFTFLGYDLATGQK